MDYNGTITFGYDAWGRMTTKSRGGQDTAYAWHYGGKLTSVTSDFPGEGNVTYAYGGDGKRRSRDDGTVTKYNWGRGETLLNEEDTNGNLTMTHIGSLASVSGATPSSGSYQYHATDIRATNRMTRDQSKVALGSNEYDPLGVSVARQGSQPLAGYAGHRWDPVAALMFSSPSPPGTGRSLGPNGGNGGGRSYGPPSGAGPGTPLQKPPKPTSCKVKVLNLVKADASKIQTAMGIPSQDQVAATDVRVRIMSGGKGVSMRRNSIWIGEEKCEGDFENEQNGLHCLVAHELAHAFDDFWRPIYAYNRWVLDSDIGSLLTTVNFLGYSFWNWLWGEEWVTLGEPSRAMAQKSWQNIETNADSILKNVYPKCKKQGGVP